MVIWFIGLSGSGKTTVGKIFYKILKKKKRNTIWLDGDMVRKIYNDKLGFTKKDREINAERLSRLSKFLSDQNINVVGSVLSNFPKWQKWNKKNIKNYKQVYIKVSLDNLLKRDKKNLYEKAIKKKRKNVVGIDIKFYEPFNSDLIIDNNVETKKFNNIIKILNVFLKKNKKLIY